MRLKILLPILIFTVLSGCGTESQMLCGKVFRVSNSGEDVGFMRFSDNSVSSFNHFQISEEKASPHRYELITRNDQVVLRTGYYNRESFETTWHHHEYIQEGGVFILQNDNPASPVSSVLTPLSANETSHLERASLQAEKALATCMQRSKESVSKKYPFELIAHFVENGQAVDILDSETEIQFLIKWRQDRGNESPIYGKARFTVNVSEDSFEILAEDYS